LAEDYWYDEDLRADIHKIHQYLDALDETGKVLSIDKALSCVVKQI
jgi:hypothetical protein